MYDILSLDRRETQKAHEPDVSSHGDHIRRLLDATQLRAPYHGVQHGLHQEAVLFERLLHRSRHRHVIDHLQSIPLRLAQC